jgi:hypothetical protein
MERYELTEKEYNAVVALNARYCWGFSRRMLMDLLRRYRKAYDAGDVRKMALYEERLTDANFHTECGYLVDKDFDGFRSVVRECFRREE